MSRRTVLGFSIEGWAKRMTDMDRRIANLERRPPVPPSVPYVEPEPSGGGIPFLVAASDAPDEVKAAAAYVCDGTADEVTINAAIAAAGSATATPCVLLSEGTFDITGPLNWVHTLQGLYSAGGAAGEHPTKLEVSAAVAGAVVSCEAAANFELIAGANIGVGVEVYSLGVHNLFVRDGAGTVGVGVDVYGSCRLRDFEVDGSSAGIGVRTAAAGVIAISGGLIRGVATGLQVTVSNETVAVSSCIFQTIGTASIDTGGATMAIAGNVIDCAPVGIDNTAGGTINSDALGANTFVGGGTEIAT